MIDIVKYVCVPKSVFSTLRAHHVSSVVDFSIARPQRLAKLSQDGEVTGYTEWACDWRDAQIFVGWNWGVVSNVVIVLNPVEIRTNLRLLAADGRVESLLVTRIHILEWIESLPWREIVLAYSLTKM